jgi:hypothetical protein
MNLYTQILRKYESDLRDAIRNRDREEGHSINQALELKESIDWSFVATALDVIGDTTCAIQHFLETGLEGLSEDTGVGEKYLRLYGVLNSTYLQQEAIGVLYQKIINPNYTKKDRGKLFDGLSIRKIRNKIGSHSSDYNHGNESYVVIRHTLSKYSFEFMNNYSLKKDRVNLKECLEKHLILIIKLFDELYERSINALYKNNPRLKEELDKLSYLRKMKEKHIN